MAVIYKLWEHPWDNDAVELDSERGVCVISEKVHDSSLGSLRR